MRASPRAWTAFVAIAAGLVVSAAAATASGAPRTASGGGSEVVATIEVGGAPSSIVATARAVWVSLGLGGIARVDPASNEVAARLRPGGAVVDLAAGYGAVWAVDVFGDRLLRIDPRTGRVTGRTRVGELPSRVIVGHGLVWVTSQLRSTVSGVDPRTGRVVKVVQFSYGELWPGGIAVTPDGVWVVTAAGDELTLVDPERMVVARRVSVRGARTLAVTGRSLWVGLARSGALLRIDPDAVPRIATGGFRAGGYGPALAGGSRLVLATGEGVAVVDPTRMAPRSLLRFSREHDVTAIAVHRDVWIADQEHGALLRVRPRAAPGRLLAASLLHRPA